MTTPTKNEQYIGKIVIKDMEEVSVFGPTLTDTFIELNRYIEQYKLQGPMDIAVYKDGFKDPIAIAEQEVRTPTPKQVKTIIKMIPQKYVLWYHWSLTEFVEFIITEWEKIRRKQK